MKAEYQAKEWLKVGANMAYSIPTMGFPGSQTSWGSSGNLFYVSSLIAPIYPMYVRNADGTIKVDSNGYTVYDFGTLDSSNPDPFFPFHVQPGHHFVAGRFQFLYGQPGR